MPKTILVIALAFGLAGCKHLPQDADGACDKLADWSDRKACKDKQSTGQKAWEKRGSK